MLFREQPAGAAQASLYLVRYHGDIVFGAYAPYFLQVSHWWNDDSGLALNRFDQKCNRVRRYGVFQRL